MCDLSRPEFHDADKAREWLEARVWKNGRTCPHCGAVDQSTLMKGKSHRPGLYQCNACREPFTVTVGTLYERSKVPLNKWLAATHLIMASKKGISALQVGRFLGLSKKTAWFLCHRIRESVRGEISLPPLGGEGAVVEADETYIGMKAGKVKRKGYGHKRTVFSLVERGGEVRSFHVENASAATLLPIMQKNIAKETALMTDEASQYRKMGDHFDRHEFTSHGAGEYVRGAIHSNTIEGFFSVFKRGMLGTYQHCGEQHLHRYLAEFDFRYSNRQKLGFSDADRMEKSIAGIVGKRLTYRRVSGAEKA
jgi:transposase-like protein